MGSHKVKLLSIVLGFLFLFGTSGSFGYAQNLQDSGDNTNGNGNNHDVTVKVATYNTRAGVGSDGQFDLDRIADTIRDTGADIIGLEEVDVHWGSRSNFENEIKVLADKLNMNYFFAPIYNMEPSKPGDERRKFGVAVLSKYPILKTENHEITRLSTQDENPLPKLAPGFLEAQIHVAGEKVRFYVTHLDYRGDPSVREMQVSDTLNIIPEQGNNILVGDMNASPDAAELAPLFAQFQDAWAMTQDTPGYTYPAEDPVKRIDDILVSPGINIQSTHIFDSLASDHRPVTADLQLTAGSHPFHASGLQVLVQYMQDKGAFTSDKAAHVLKLHLAAVKHYETKKSADKVVKHMKGFKLLLDHQKNNGLISDEAYQTLNTDADYLIDKWQ